MGKQYKVQISDHMKARIALLTDGERAAVMKAATKLMTDAKWLDEKFEALGASKEVRAKLMAGVDIRDAIPAQMMARALEYAVAQAIYITTTYTVWRSVLPIDTDMPAGADTKVYTIWEAAGMAEWYRGGGKHPSVEVGQRRITINFSVISTSFTIDWLEMLGNSYAGVNSEAEKARACFDYLDRKVESIVFEGDTTMDRPPLIDHPNITSGNMTTGSLASATAAEFLADMKYGITQVYDQCKDDEAFLPMMVDIMLSPTLYRIATSKIANSYTNQTIEQVLRASDGKFGRFIVSPKHGSVDSGTNITFGTFGDRDSLCVSLSMDRQRITPTVLGSVTNQPVVSKIGRLHVKRPLRFWQGANA